MLIAWAFCNRGRNPADAAVPHAVLVCCPNLTVKERLQVLRPENARTTTTPRSTWSRSKLPPAAAGRQGAGRRTGTGFAPESEHNEGDRSYAVVNKGAETPETFARRVLGDLYDRDADHGAERRGPPLLAARARRRRSRSSRPRSGRALEDEARRRTVWLDGPGPDQQRRPMASDAGHLMCVDLSATPFYLKGSGYPEGRPFPWLVSDFGLVDAIESGIVKIPRLPVLRHHRPARPEVLPALGDDQRGPPAGRAAAGQGRQAEAGGGLPRGRGRPPADRRPVDGAVQARSRQATPGQERVPPVLIIVCDNTDIAEVFYRKISGETEARSRHRGGCRRGDGGGDEENGERRAGQGQKGKKPKTQTVYGQGAVYPELLLEHADREADDPHRHEAARRGRERGPEQGAGETRPRNCGRSWPRSGKPGQPGEQVRCVVSVAMLTEGWDANNVTHILGRAGLRQPAALRAGRRPRPAADGLHAGPGDRPAHRGVRRRLRHPVLGDPVQGAASQERRSRRTSRRTTSRPCPSAQAWRCGSPWWRATPSRCGGT